ncbi:MAG: hypothetical protein Q9194_002633 [Teloschistes cf. exilis]
MTVAGIAVSNTPGAVNASTANTAIYLLLGALRRAHIAATALRQGQWRGSMGLGHDPEGKMLGILGMGGIGSALAVRAAPFGLKMQYHNRNPVVHPCSNLLNVQYVSFEKLLRTSDIISIHLPLNNSTKGLIGRKEFRMMKDGVVIVNTARGKIMDEEALVEALDVGKVFAAGLDVYEKEPEVHPGLIRSDKVVLTPHVGTATLETVSKKQIAMTRPVPVKPAARGVSYRSSFLPMFARPNLYLMSIVPPIAQSLVALVSRILSSFSIHPARTSILDFLILIHYQLHTFYKH